MLRYLIRIPDFVNHKKLRIWSHLKDEPLLITYHGILFADSVRIDDSSSAVIAASSCVDWNHIVDRSSSGPLVQESYGDLFFNTIP